MARAAKPKGKRADPDKVTREHPLARPLLHFSTVFGKMVEALGIPAAVLILLLGGVYFLGDEKTRNDFVRELLFGELNQRPFLSIFFGLLILMMLVGGGLRRKDKKMESAEIKRIADEKGRLQARIIGKDLAHTDGVSPTEQQSRQLSADSQKDTISPLGKAQTEIIVPSVTNSAAEGKK